MDRRFEKLSFDRERRTWTVETTCGNGTSETFQARHVVSSPPIPELLSALSPTPLTLFHARALKYRDFLTVVLIGKSQRQWPDNWIYIHDLRVKVGRVQNFRSWSPEMVPGRCGGRMVFRGSCPRAAIRRRRRGVGGRDLCRSAAQRLWRVLSVRICGTLKPFHALSPRLSCWPGSPRSRQDATLFAFAVSSRRRFCIRSWRSPGLASLLPSAAWKINAGFGFAPARELFRCWPAPAACL